MKILISNNHLDFLGGSETFTYTLAVEMKRKGHEVDILTPKPGIVSERLREENNMNINSISPEYDLCLLNHNTTIDWVLKNMKTQDLGKVVQTCHGFIPPLEQPHHSLPNIKYVAVSGEVRDHLFTKNLTSSVINNGIDLERFSLDTNSGEEFTKICSLSQSEHFNNILSQVAEYFGVEITYNDKYKNPVWDIENQIRGSQLVFGLGRSAYEGLAMGKCVFAGDARGYMGGRMDGIINENNIEDFVYNNCSGRNRNINPTVENIINEIKNNFIEAEPINSRKIAEEYFDIKKQTQKYLDLIK
jgi:glycosyltransferase involved in cell wall biosynthesis